MLATCWTMPDVPGMLNKVDMSRSWYRLKETHCIQGGDKEHLHLSALRQHCLSQAPDLQMPHRASG